MLFDVALVAHAPGGARLGSLPAPLELSVGTPLNDMPSLTFTYPVDGPGLELLSQPVEIGLEILNPATGAWVEPDDARFLRLEWSHDNLEDVPVVKYTCPGYAWLLSKGVVYPPPSSIKQAAITEATAKLNTANVAYNSAKTSLRLACGLAAKGGVVFADYAPNVSTNGVWVDTSGKGKAYKGVTTGKGASKVSTWNAVPGADGAATFAMAAKVDYDSASGGLTSAKNNKSIARIFNKASAGEIVGTLVAEAKARGALAGLEFNFGSGKTTDGANWAKAIAEYEIPAGTKLLNILNTMAEQGLCDWRVSGRELQLFNPDTAMARNLSGSVVLVNGVDISDAPDRGTLGNVAGKILFTGDEGMNFELTNPSAPAPWGDWEDSVSQSGVTSKAAGQLLGKTALDAGAAEQIESTRQLVFGEQTPTPWLNYRVGDYVTAPGPRGGMDTMRIRQITITRSNEGIVSGSLVLNDRFVEKAIKSQRKVAGLFGGASSGGNGAIPAPLPSQDSRTPAPAFDLVVEPDVYIDKSGEARGLIASGFQHDGTATTGNLMDIDRHILYYAPMLAHGAIDGTWRSIGSVDWPGEEIFADGLLVSRPDGTAAQYSFHLRSVGVNGKVSAPSNSVTVTMVQDTEPPAVPQFLPQDVTTWLRTATVRWRGKGLSDLIVVDMPLDFDRCNVYQSTTALGPWKQVGAIRGANTLWQSDTLPKDKEVFFALTAVDRTGNESATSIPQSVTPVANVNVAEIASEMDAADVVLKNAGQILVEADKTLGDKLAELNADTSDLADKVVEAMASADGKTTNYFTQPTDTTKLVLGDTWFDSANGNRPNYWDGNKWVAALLGGSAIEDLAITNAKIGAIDAAKISTGYLDVANRISAGSLTADKIVVGGDNAIVDPHFANATINAVRRGRTTVLGNYLTSGGVTKFGGAGQQTVNVKNFFFAVGTGYDQNTMIPVAAGDTWKFRAKVDSTGGGARFCVYVRMKDGTLNYYGLAGYDTYSAAGTGVALSASLTILDAWSHILPAIMFEAPTTACYVHQGASVNRMGSGELIVNGTIRGQHLVAETITANELAANSVTAWQIAANSVTAESLVANSVTAGKLAADVVTSREIKALSITAGLIAANTITSDQINAGSIRTAILTANAITSTMISGTAIDGKTITGAKIQTSATANRGIELTTAGLNGYDATGVNVFSLSATTGALSLRGDIRSVSLGGNQFWAGGNMQNSGATGAAARPGIVFKSDAVENSPAAIYRDGSWGAIMIDSPYSDNTTNVAQSTISVSNHGIEMWASKKGDLTGPSTPSRQMLNLSANNTDWWIGSGTGSLADYTVLSNSNRLLVSRNNNHYLHLRSDRGTDLYTSRLDITGPLYATAKNFKITHPTKPGMDLYHGSTESPLAGVEYWGEGQLDGTGSTAIKLPEYFEALTKQRNRAILITPKDQVDLLATTDIVDGTFIVTGTAGQRFTWLVKAKRSGADFEVEQPSRVPDAEPETD